MARVFLARGQPGPGDDMDDDMDDVMDDVMDGMAWRRRGRVVQRTRGGAGAREVNVPWMCPSRLATHDAR